MLINWPTKARSVNAKALHWKVVGGRATLGVIASECTTIECPHQMTVSVPIGANRSKHGRRDRRVQTMVGGYKNEID